jgi:DNA-directed RNA polymerase specialized sigma24 family protein
MRRTIPRLTDAQRDMAADPAALDYARRVAAAYVRARPELADEINAAALFGVVCAAASHDPAKGAWPYRPHLARRVAGEIVDWLRSMMPKGFRRAEHSARGRGAPVPLVESLSFVLGAGAGAPLELGDVLPADELPVGWELESADEVKALTAELPPKYARAWRLHYLHAGCESQKATAAALGCHETNVHYMLKRGAAILRERFGATGEGPGK